MGNDYRTVNWKRCRSCHGLIWSNVLAFGWRHWGKPQKLSVWIAGDLVEIWTGNLLNTSREWYKQNRLAWLKTTTLQEILRIVWYLVSDRPVAGREGRLQPVRRQRDQRIVLVIRALRASTVSRKCV
jgi:hypothetical protein